MKKENFIIVGITMIIVTISVSLAYFAAKIVGTPKDIDLAMKDLYVEFTDNTAELNASGITPGWTYEKTFTIENKSESEYKYNIIIKDIVNNFVTNNLQYKITNTSDNDGYSMSEFETLYKSENKKDGILAYSVSISSGVKQVYKLELRYLDSDEQNSDMGKRFSGKLFITEGTIDPALYAGYEKGTLGYKIMEDNLMRSTRSNNNNGVNDFATPLTATTTGTLFTSTESITGITDSPREVYYYAGNTTNNWVKFGKYQNDWVIYRGYLTGSTSYMVYSTMDECTSASSYNVNCTQHKYANAGDDMYWRIIRTNYDGSIKLLYAGTRPSTASGNIGESSFNKKSDSPKYIGYKYGEDTSLDTIRNNTTDSTIKIFIDSWYQNNLTDYTKYLSTSAVYCNDRSAGTGQTYNYASSPSSQFNFAPRYRMDYDTKGAGANPTYNCTDIRDAFSVDNKSAKLDYPVALMTADEIAFAGGVAYQKMSTPYAWFISNSTGSQVSSSMWSLSPLDWGGNLSAVWVVHDSGFFGAVGIGDVRPTISLKSCTKRASGDGSASSPYTITLDPDISC